MPGFTLNKVDLGNTPTGTQTYTFEYKLWNATTYTNISTTAVVNTNGTLVTPLAVTGLTSGQQYYVRSWNNCEPTLKFVQPIQIP